jgi:hypothetical protein
VQCQPLPLPGGFLSSFLPYFIWHRGRWKIRLMRKMPCDESIVFFKSTIWWVSPQHEEFCGKFGCSLLLLRPKKDIHWSLWTGFASIYILSIIFYWFSDFSQCKYSLSVVSDYFSCLLRKR